MKSGIGVLGLIPLMAAAGPRTLVVATGDCRDGQLAGAMAAFTEALIPRLGADAVAGDELLARLRPQPSEGVEELQRLFETAQTQYYSVQYQKAADALAHAIDELQRMPPSPRATKLLWSCHVLHGLSLQKLGRRADGAEAWKRVLQVDSTFAMDPDWYSPAMRQQFDAVRKDVARSRRATLTVQSSPPGAEVHVEGQPVGKTPLKLSLPRSSYRVVVARADQVGFAHVVQLDGDTPLQVDVDFEAALRPQLPLCLQSNGALAHALKLAALAKADDVVVLRTESRDTEAPWVAAVRMEVKSGARVREGGLKGARGGPTAGLDELADFVVTGRVGRVVIPVVNSPPPTAAALGAEPPSTLEAAQVEATPAALRSGVRWVGAGVAAAGVLVAAAGGGVYLAGAPDRERLGELVDANGAVPPVGTPGYDEAVRLNRDVTARNTLAVGLAAGGAAAAVAGAVIFVVATPRQARPALSLSAGPGGATLSGRF